MKVRIQEDIKIAMKARDQKKLDNLRQVMAAIKQVEVDTRKEVDDNTVLTILQKEIKKRKDALDFAKKAARQDLIDQNEYEITLIKSYLGEQLSEEKLSGIISELIKQGNDNIGALMALLNKDYKGKFDGRTASNLIKQALSQ